MQSFKITHNQHSVLLPFKCQIISSSQTHDSESSFKIHCHDIAVVSSKSDTTKYEKKYQVLWGGRGGEALPDTVTAICLKYKVVSDVSPHHGSPLQTHLLACCICQHVCSQGIQCCMAQQKHIAEIFPLVMLPIPPKTYVGCIMYYKISICDTRLIQSLVWKIRWKLELDGKVPNSPQWSQTVEARVIQKFVILTNSFVTWSHWSWDCTLELQFLLTSKSARKPRHSSGRKNHYTANFIASGTDKCYIQVLF